MNPPGDPDISIERHKVVDSTNRRAADAVRAGRVAGSGVVVVAEEQRQGEGRAGRRWHSPPGGLWFTLAAPLRGNAEPAMAALGLRVGLACLDAVDETIRDAGAAASVGLRWPNDVLIDGRKVCGCMCRVVGHGGGLFALVGVGVNANNPSAALPAPLRTPAVSLAEAIGRPVDLESLLARLTDQLRRALGHSSRDAAELARAERSLVGLGSQCAVTTPSGGAHRGVLIGLAPDGALRLRTGAGELVIRAALDVEC